jgi:hypothetical protein
MKESAKSGTNMSTKRTSFSRSSTIEHTKKMLSTWLDDQN